MAWRFKLAGPVQSEVNTLREMLSGEIQNHRENFEDRSDGWIDSDAGTAVAAWLDELESVMDSLESVDNEPNS